MNKKALFADVTENGAVLLGESLTVDGHHDRPFRGVTHFHADHIKDLRESLRAGLSLITTKATADALAVLGYRIDEQRKILLDYNRKIQLGNDVLSLLRAKHVFGSAQYYVETETKTVGYTGDFKDPGRGTEIMKPDILVIDTTYGDPSYVRPFKEEVEVMFGDHVKDALTRGPVRVFGYHGKIQESMETLRRMGVDAPFLASDRVYRMTQVAIDNGMPLQKIYEANSPEGREIIKDGWYVEFAHYNSFSRRERGRWTDFVLTGWEFSRPVSKNYDGSYKVAFSDHADFEDTVKYIEKSSPGLVILDSSRNGSVDKLRVWIEKNLKIKALPRPNGKRDMYLEFL